MIPFFRQCIIIIQCGLIIFSVKAEVTTDGSLGYGAALPGPHYQISAGWGQQHGGNLFHSFKDFNLQSHESATFFGPDTVQNIISRVTGGNPSSIDGRIRSQIPNADMYLLNPNGIMFGPNAKLNVQGSFYASTVDYFQFEDGKRFNAKNPNNIILTVASIESFGFLKDSSPTTISVDGSELSVASKKTLSFISGGDINIINQAKLTAPVGKITLGSLQDINVNQAEFTARYGDISFISSKGINIDQAKLTAPLGRINFESVQNININQAEFTADYGSIFFKSVQGIDINQAKFAASYGITAFESLTGQDIKIKQTNLTTPYGEIFFVNSTDPSYFENLITAGNFNYRQYPLTFQFDSAFFADLIRANLTYFPSFLFYAVEEDLNKQGVYVDQVKLTDFPSEIFLVNLTDQYTKINSFFISKYEPVNNKGSNFSTIEKVKAKLISAFTMPIVFSVNKLLINQCAGLTREDLSTFFTYKGQKTRPTAPDDLKTHAIKATDILPFAAYKTNKSQIVTSFDKNLQPPRLRIGCAGK